jgi:hypothetical protein
METGDYGIERNARNKHGDLTKYRASSPEW